MVQIARLLRQRRGTGMAVRLGINPITWTNDDLPSLGGDTPLEICLSETRQAGFCGHRDGRQVPEERRPSSARSWQAHGLDLVSGWYDGRINEREIDAEWDGRSCRI